MSEMYYFLGLLVGVIMTAFLATLAVSSNYESGLRICAQEHNVFKCEYIAVPVAGDAP